MHTSHEQLLPAILHKLLTDKRPALPAPRYSIKDAPDQAAPHLATLCGAPGHGLHPGSQLRTRCPQRARRPGQQARPDAVLSPGCSCCFCQTCSLCRLRCSASACWHLPRCKSFLKLPVMTDQLRVAGSVNAWTSRCRQQTHQLGDRPQQQQPPQLRTLQGPRTGPGAYPDPTPTFQQCVPPAGRPPAGTAPGARTSGCGAPRGLARALAALAGRP